MIVMGFVVMLFLQNLEFLETKTRGAMEAAETTSTMMTPTKAAATVKSVATMTEFFEF